MNLPLFIARKYFLSGKKKNFINIISIISMIVVAFGTMCLIIALSVFNGFSGLLEGVYGNFDPDIIIEPNEGKSFKRNDKLIDGLKEMNGVLAVIEVIEDNVLIEYNGAQRLVKMKGISPEFEKFSGIRNVLVDGQLSLFRDSVNYALIGQGVQYDLSLNLKNAFSSMQIYYPKNIAPGVVNPEKMYTLQHIMPGGIFAIEKFYDDNYIFVPLPFAQSLLNYKNKRTQLEIEIEEGRSISSIKDQLKKKLGHGFIVKSGEELHSDLYKILKIEKWFTFFIFTVIIGIASINIFFSLTMLVIDKKKDIAVLIAHGACSSTVRKIFLYEGYIVAFTGAIIGLGLGLTLTFLQDQYGFISMGMESAVVSSYPVSIVWTDVLSTVLVVIFITVLSSIQPANKASKSFSISTL